MSKNTRKNTNRQKCIHCLQIHDEITDDHVIPKSWYSKIESKTAYKPTAPACLECNHRLGKQEQFISHIMWMCMPETNPLVPELREKVYRACGIGSDRKPLLGLKPEDRLHRQNYLKRLLSSTLPAGDLDERLLMPGFTFHSGYPKDKQRYTQFDNKLVEDLAAKVVRGLEYIQGKRERYIEPPYKLE